MSVQTSCRSRPSNYSLLQQVCLWISNDNPMVTHFMQPSALLCQWQVGAGQIYHKPHAGRLEVVQEMSLQLKFQMQKTKCYFNNYKLNSGGGCGTQSGCIFLGSFSNFLFCHPHSWVLIIMNIFNTVVNHPGVLLTSTLEEHYEELQMTSDSLRHWRL